ncbi:Uncharacterised protein [Sebaldella termitidis]|jgi:hypothetical protein|uniref:Uncharacterized protein n=1 Tax=Sebaldella termitidis (strain ATCC 33386 / NCTC 11300) TaxID=526218 RepID=D1AJP9_SEBTE|nr:hypothetical protein [Sebaldella termitidis]ACZ06956.1 hypothetical protein Sterm_0068 [Sebaldella termitidis ATCC 33386]SUI22244.1 Uncharacterised protein [Sebaldella termitidis]
MENEKISESISIDNLILKKSSEKEIPTEEWKYITELNLEYIDVLSEIAYRIYDDKMFFKGKIKYKKIEDNDDVLCELKLFRTEPVNLDVSAVNTNYGEIFSINRDGYIIDKTYLKNYNDEREINLDSFCLNI